MIERAAVSEAAEAPDVPDEPRGTGERKLERGDTQRKVALVATIGRWLVATAASIAFALSFGFDYGVDNQVAYLLGGLRLANPSLLNNDWYAAHTTNYHPTFELLSGLLLKIDHSGWSIAITQTVVIAIGMVLTYWAIEILAGKRVALPAFLLLLAFTFLTRTAGVGISYIFDHILQPSTLGSLFFVAALPFFLRGKWLASGIFIALSGAFHANYLVLFFPVFGLAHVCMGKEDLARRLLRQLGPPVIVVVLLSKLFLASAHSPLGKEAEYILFHIRSPHHYLPATYEDHFMPFLGWQVLGLGAGWSILRGIHKPGGRLGALLIGLLVTIWAGTALTTNLLYVPRVAQIFVWRFAPFSDLWFQLLVCVALVRSIMDPPGVPRHFPKPAVIAIAAGLGFLLMYYGDARDRPMLNLLVTLSDVGIGLLVVVVAMRWLDGVARFEKLKGPAGRVWKHAGLWLSLAGAAVLVIGNAEKPLSTVKQRSILIRGFNPQLAELYRWMRTSTPKDARFLSPPGIETVRYRGERAIVVDWKSTPILPREIVEWAKRMADVTGHTVLRSWRDISGYDMIDQQRLDMLKRKYHFDYAIVRPGRERVLRGRVVFRNRVAVVLKLD